MIAKLLTEHHLEFLSLKGGCRRLFESTLVKMSNSWKSHAAAQLLFTKCSCIVYQINGNIADYFAVWQRSLSFQPYSSNS